MPTVTFTYAAEMYGYFYTCSTPGDQSGEYVPAAELARVIAQRDALLAACLRARKAIFVGIAAKGDTTNGYEEVALLDIDAAVSPARRGPG